MKRYEKYKDSGFIDIGEIPVNWQVVNFRYLIDILTDFTANGSFGDLAKNVEYLDEGYSRLIRLTDLRSNYENVGIYISEDAHSYLSKSELFGDEVLLANVGAYAGLAWMFKNFNGKATLGPNMFLLRFNSKLNNDFAYISLISNYLHNQLLNKATSSAQPKLNKDDVRSCHFILPPFSEQTAIAAFLNHKTAQIDALIEKKEQLVEKLKGQRQAIINEAVTKGLNPNIPMKDSGIECLGEIPEHWEVNFIKRGVDLLTDYEANGSFDSIKNNVIFTDETGYAWYVRATDLENNFISDENLVRWVDENSYNFLEKTKLFGGELLVAKRGEIGKVYLMPKVTVKATLAPNLYLVRLNEKLDAQFVWYFFESELGKSQLKLKDRSTTMGALYKDDFKEIPIVFPPFEEQVEIKNNLNIISEKYNNVTESVSLSIDKLKLYRQSFISEAVTDKIDVRDWELTKTN